MINKEKREQGKVLPPLLVVRTNSNFLEKPPIRFVKNSDQICEQTSSQICEKLSKRLLNNLHQIF